MSSRHCPACASSEGDDKHPVVSKFLGTSRHVHSCNGLHLAEVTHSTAVALPRHAHARAFVSVLLSGDYVSIYGGQHEQFLPGRAVFHERGFDHEDWIGRDGAHFFCLQIDDDLLEKIDQYSPGGIGSAPLDSHASTALLRLFTLNRRDPDTLEVESAFAEFLSYAAHPAHRSEDRRASWLRPVRERLIDLPGERICMEALSQMAGVHPAHLARSFRSRFGCSIGTYAKTARLASAWRMLSEERRQIAEIAFDLGYADQAHLTREFSATIGAPPARVRRLLAA